MKERIDQDVLISQQEEELSRCGFCLGCWSRAGISISPLI
jgi:hypothetical protein